MLGMDVDDLRKVQGTIRADAGAVSAPQCPKCKTHRVEVHYGLYVPDGKVSPHQAICRDCRYLADKAQSIAEFAKFFQPAAQPSPEGGSKP